MKYIPCSVLELPILHRTRISGNTTGNRKQLLRLEKGASNPNLEVRLREKLKINFPDQIITTPCCFSDEDEKYLAIWEVKRQRNSRHKALMRKEIEDMAEKLKEEKHGWT